MSARLTFTQIVTRCAAGLLIGQGFVIVLDRAIGGPGPFVMFGL